MLRAPIGSDVSLEVTGDDHVVYATDIAGFDAADIEERSSAFQFRVDSEEPYFVFVNSTVEGPTTATLVSSHAVVPWNDQDDDR